MENSEPPTILIVDDAPEDLKVLIMFLEEAGFRAEASQSGEDALKLIDQTRPDLILLDVLMSGMDGFETCRRVKACEATRDIPVIFLTALADTVEKVEGFEAGGVDYLTKPVHPKEFLARINVHLTIRKLQQQIQEQHILLEEQNARFHILPDMTFVGIIMHDGERVIEVNQTIEEMFGYPRADLLGRHIFEFATPESRQIIAEHIRTGDETPYRAEGIRRDGSIVPVEIEARNMTHQGRNVRAVVLRDLSWQRTMEEEQAHLQQENIALRASIKDHYRFGDMIGRSPAMQEVFLLIGSAAASETNVIICGESGTGKELVARTIHTLSSRKDNPFVAVNCGAVPDSLFEREFFGHRKGAFTGADRNSPGYFDRAHRGTLFLDEISELPPPLQVKLLRVLEDGTYMPVGDTTSKQVDARIIAATNKDLRELLHQGTIREDFFYRIYVTVITLPPLRDRREDIPLLIEHFLKQYGYDEACPTLPTEIMEELCTYHWPGNVRELQNELHRYVTEQRLEFLGHTLPHPASADWSINPTTMTFHEAVEAFEKQMIATALAHNAWHHGKTAKMLAIPPKTLYNKIKKYGLEDKKEG
jgi:PAS domain S-box-containing protein